MVTLEGHTVVDAALIKPWSASHNDCPTNGMACVNSATGDLMKGLCHGDKYQVLISPAVKNEPNLPGHMLTLSGRAMFLRLKAGFIQIRKILLAQERAIQEKRVMRTELVPIVTVNRTDNRYVFRPDEIGNKSWTVFGLATYFLVAGIKGSHFISDLDQNPSHISSGRILESLPEKINDMKVACRKNFFNIRF